MATDMGLTPAMQAQISKSYVANMAVIYAELLKRGMFSWQQQWNGQSDPHAKNGCGYTSTLLRTPSRGCPAVYQYHPPRAMGRALPGGHACGMRMCACNLIS